MRMRRAVTLFAVLAIAMTSHALPAVAGGGDRLPDGVDPATGFRMQRYRAPTPDSLPGGSVADTAAVRAAMADGRTILIDVYPPKGAGPDPLDGSWRNAETRDNIPGSAWLPEVGRGYLTDDYATYFRRNLAALTKGDMDRPLLFYCTADCWQGWNAARRAIVWGHRAVSWYPGGTDQWMLDGGETAPAEAVNFLDEP
ncbi:hypothetical protein CSC94_11670 [Zhengella mangrovi]|uniref:Rhodanese domain-containing protein n=2 Tax=Zhengella mangrovi TaxID=1982044 RepID=A0A2G1QMS0_9HYPH|nr:hypothetical protein CSC94_11670 [Zhengella mangrovi]